MKEILSFLQGEGPVSFDRELNLYKHVGKSIHLAKDSPCHASFQKVRREMVMRRLDDDRLPQDLLFSSAFATSRDHQGQIRRDLLKLIEGTHKQLERTNSEEVFLLVVD